MRTLLGKAADGRVHLSGIPAGTWLISVHRFDPDCWWQSVATEVVLTPGQPARPTITVKRLPR
jgi:hypothetical protein